MPYYHKQTIADLARVTFGRKHFSKRRVIYNTALLAIHQAIYGTQKIGEAVDELLYSEYREQQLPSPVYVMAIMRSGTTYLHSLLSMDEERFSHLKLYQTMAPSPSLYRFFDRLGELDQRYHLGLGRIVDRVDEHIFPTWDDLHQIGLRAPEEDEALFLLQLLSPGVYFLTPFIDDVPSPASTDDLPADIRHLVAQNYRKALQKHLFAEGRTRIPLLKCVLLGGRLRVILEAFPDLRVIHLVRNPYDVLPATMSMYYKVWERHSPEIRSDGPEVRRLAELWMRYYRRMYDLRDDVPEGHHITFRYEDLVADPITIIEKAYDAFGFDLSADFRGKLEAATSKARSFKSAHEYTLEEYGLSPEIIDRELGDLMDRFGYERRGKTNGAAHAHG